MNPKPNSPEGGKFAPPPRIEGQTIWLEPLAEHHAEKLWEASQDAGIWKWMPRQIDTKEEFSDLFRFLMESQTAGTMFPFVLFDKKSGRCAGSSSYLNLDRFHHRLEIGYTWISPAFQKTHVNTEAKYLLLRHAFEKMACVRVEFKTDALNSRSRAALKRIGAREEGTLRRHMVVQKGRIRDTVYFSVLDSEWPLVKAALERKMEPRNP
jgi:RimJ/RimL family protein N-acetyltransferase